MNLTKISIAGAGLLLSWIALMPRAGNLLTSAQAAPAQSAYSALFHGTRSTLPATTLAGKSVNLATQPGWRVIYFWSADCPCVRACERYSFVPLARKYQGLVSFYAVADCGSDLSKPLAELQQSINSRHLPFPVLLDPKHKVVIALKARVTPQTFLLDPAGRVVFSGMPDDSRRYLGDPKQGVSQTYLAKALSEGLAGRPITQPHTENQGCIISW